MPLSSTDPLIAVPSSLTIPADADSAEFDVTGQAVASDREGSVVAEAYGRSLSAALALWASTPNTRPLFRFISDENGPTGRNDARQIGAGANFQAWCSQSRVVITARTTSDFWRLEFGAPLGVPIGVGTYENTVPGPAASSDRPLLSISGNGTCSATGGRFVVHEVDVTSNGLVRAFWASFDQPCQNRAVRGDVAVTNPPGLGSVSSCVVGPPR